jgi:hypothetical protein
VEVPWKIVTTIRSYRKSFYVIVPYRAYSAATLIAMGADKLLSLHRPPFDQEHITRVTEALTEKIYLHGHGIGRNEAKEIGLDVEEADNTLEQACWNLYLQYESALGLLECNDPTAYFPDDDTDIYTRQGIVSACIESRNLLHTFTGDLKLQRRRRYPPQPTINVNLGVQIPDAINIDQLPRVIQEALNKILQEAVADIQQQVQREIARQAPVEGIDLQLTGAQWHNAEDLP